MLTVVLDTQIILMAWRLLSQVQHHGKIYATGNGGRFTLLLSEPTVAEIEVVMVRPEVLNKIR